MGSAGAPDKKEKTLADGQAQGGTQRRGGKSDAAFRTISEVATELDVPQHVLRFWETKFSQIRPMKRGGGRRYYRPEDVVLLTTIRDLLYREGYTIKGVQKLLRDNGAKAVVSALQERGEDETNALALVGMAAAAQEGGVSTAGAETGDADAVSDDAPEAVPEAMTLADVPPPSGDGEATVLEAASAASEDMDEGIESGADAMMADAMTADAGDPVGLHPGHRRELESILEDLVALRSLMGQALDATHPPPAPSAL